MRSAVTMTFDFAVPLIPRTMYTKRASKPYRVGAGLSREKARETVIIGVCGRGLSARQNPPLASSHLSSKFGVARRMVSE